MQLNTALIIFAIVQSLVGLLVAIIGFFGARTLRSVDTNQTTLFERMHILEKDFYVLQGEHKTQHKERS